MKRVLRIAALPVAAAVIALVAALFLGVDGQGLGGRRIAGKWCAGQKIVFFPGGPAGGVFAVNVYNGAKQAAADLGRQRAVRLVELGSARRWSASSSRRSRRTRPGIAVMGHPGDAALKTVGGPGRGEGHHRHEPEHRAADALQEVPGEGLRLRRPEPLQLGLPARPVGRRPAASEEGRPGDGLGAALPADARPAHEGRDRRAEEGGPEGRLHRDQHSRRTPTRPRASRPSPPTSPRIRTSSWSSPTTAA